MMNVTINLLEDEIERLRKRVSECQEAATRFELKSREEKERADKLQKKLEEIEESHGE
jgi:hypothetical protein